MIKRALFAVLASATFATAGSAPVDFKKVMIEPEPEVTIERTQISTSGSWVGESGFRRGAGKFGEQGVYESAISVTHRFALSDRWYLKVGANYHRFDFTTSNAPVDTTLQGIAGTVALEYVVNARVGLFIESAPGFYFSDSLTSRAFDAPTVAAAAIPIGGNSFYLIAGVAYSGLREYTFLPLLGFKWTINPQWVLNAYLPEPRLIYSPNDSLSFWVGGELTGGSYRTADHSGGPNRIDNAVVSYREYRGGAGVAYRVCSGFTVEAEAGYAFSRSFDYHRAGEVYGLEGAPFVKLGARLTF